MSAPTKTRRDYRDAAGKRLPGVTTVIGHLAKPALLSWYARVGAEAAAHAIVDGRSLDVAIHMGAAAPNTRRDAAADAGTLAHSLVEAFYAGEAVIADVTDVQQAAAHAAFCRIRNHIEATSTTVLRSECALVDQERGYGGTMDLVVERDGLRYIADVKTGKGVYDEVVVQLAAYRCLWMHHYPEQPIAGALVFHAPLDGPLVEHPITSEQLDAGAAIFGALLLVHKARPSVRLGA